MSVYTRLQCTVYLWVKNYIPAYDYIYNEIVIKERSAFHLQNMIHAMKIRQRPWSKANLSLVVPKCIRLTLRDTKIWFLLGAISVHQRLKSPDGWTTRWSHIYQMHNVPKQINTYSLHKNSRTSFTHLHLSDIKLCHLVSSITYLDFSTNLMNIYERFLNFKILKN